MALAVMVLAIIGGYVGLAAAWGKIRSPKRNGVVRGLLIVVLVIALFAAIVVPSLQPYTVSRSGGCTGFASQSPCNSFWGSGSSSGANGSWGGDQGFYFMVAAAVLLVVALVFWVRAWSESWVPAPTGPVAAGAGLMTPGPDPIERLLQLKELLDSGHLSEVEFQQAKSNLFSRPVIGPTPGSSGGVEETLTRLKAMHDSGQLSDAEYAEVRGRVLGRL